MMCIIEIFGDWAEGLFRKEEAGEAMAVMKCIRNGFEWLNAPKFPIYQTHTIRLPSSKILEFITPILIMEESVWLCSKIVNLSPAQLRL